MLVKHVMIIYVFLIFIKQDVSSSGTTIICELDKNGKVKKLGDLKIHVAFSLKNDKKTAFEQYRCLLYNVVLQELKSTQVCNPISDKYMVSDKQEIVS